MEEQDKQAKMERAGVSLVIGDILIATCSREADGFGSPYGLDERITKADEIARRWNSHDALLAALNKFGVCEDFCTRRRVDFGTDECTCGLEALINKFEKGA